MENRLVKMVFVCIASSLLASCSSFNQYFGSVPSGRSAAKASGDIGDQPTSMTGHLTNMSTAVGGKFESSMDNIDRSKLSRALDSGLGKATTWTNVSSGISFTVVPTRKMSIGSNQFCRAYNITAVKGSSTDQYTGTACLGDDSNWHPM